MPRPTARVLALLELLQSGGTRTVGDLADRLGVDKRTVRRYVAHLLELDIPVDSVRGRYGGYRLGPGYRLPPLMLTDDEAVAVLVGLLSGPQPEVGASRTAAESATAKIRRVLPKSLAARLGALLDTAHFRGRAHAGSAAETGVLLLVAEAARDRRTVEIVHEGRDGRTSGRTIQPYGVVAHAGHWYLTGHDSVRHEVRTFRLDRVTTAKPGSDTFEVPASFRPQEEVLSALARTPWRHLVSVRVHADTDAIRSRLPGLATITSVTDEEGWTRIEIRAEQLDWVPGVLAGLDADLVIEGPDELRDRVLALAQRLLAACDDATDPMPPSAKGATRGPGVVDSGARVRVGRQRPPTQVSSQSGRFPRPPRSTMTNLLNTGDTFPDLDLTQVGGEVLHLPDYFAGRWGVVLFNRGSWCPFCNAQLRGFQRLLDTLTGQNAAVVSLSVDDEDTTRALIEKHHLTFPVGHSADADQISALTGAFVNVEPHYLQATGFVLDPAGRVVVSVYSSGAIGRVIAEDASGLIRYAQEHATA